MSIPGVNVLPRPPASVIFHYSATLDYKPEFTSTVRANSDDGQRHVRRDRYGAAPQGLADVVILTPTAKVAERTAEYPDIEVLAIAFKASELKAAHWKFLMGAVGSQRLYIRPIGLFREKLGGELTLVGLRKAVQDSRLSDHSKELALVSLRFAEEDIDNKQGLTDVLRPGRLAMIDLRNEFIETDELFVVPLQMLPETSYEGRPFNRLVVFDEAHQYIDSTDLVAV
jgi:DNA phosphorothioation-dependent restriction protein DptH